MNNEYNTNFGILLYLIQIIFIYNALLSGYNIKKIGVNKYELTSKRKENVDMGLNDFINNIVSFNTLV